MTIREFLSDRLGKITGQLCFTVAAALFLLATGTSSGVIVLLLLFLLLISITTQAAEYLKCRRRLSELNVLMQGLDQKYLFSECAPPPRTVYEPDRRRLGCPGFHAGVSGVYRKLGA